MMTELNAKDEVFASVQLLSRMHVLMVPVLVFPVKPRVDAFPSPLLPSRSGGSSPACNDRGFPARLSVSGYGRCLSEIWQVHEQDPFGEQPAYHNSESLDAEPFTASPDRCDECCYPG